MKKFTFLLILMVCGCVTPQKTASNLPVTANNLLQSPSETGPESLACAVVSADLANMLIHFSESSPEKRRIFIINPENKSNEWAVGREFSTIPVVQIGNRGLKRRPGRMEYRGKLAYIVECKVESITDSKATIFGEYGCSSLEDVSYRYFLEKKDGRWVIVERKFLSAS